MAETLIKFGNGSNAPENGLKQVVTRHYRPDKLSQEKKDRFDRHFEDLPHPEHEDGYQYRLFGDPKTGKVAWYRRPMPEEEGGEYGAWELALDVDLHS